MAALTARQVEAFSLARREVEAAGGPDLPATGWVWVYAPEVRPGRGHDVTATWIDSDWIVRLTFDPYGRYTVSVGRVEWIHNSDDEEERCPHCEGPMPDGLLPHVRDRHPQL